MTQNTPYITDDGKEYEIRNVWSYNLDEEMALVREACVKYPFVAMVYYKKLYKYRIQNFQV